jgi:hypothetical protein
MMDKSKGGSGGKAAAPLCVICKARAQSEKYRPFCSKRCADVDLHRWLGGVYAIPGKPEEEEDEGSPSRERGGGEG